MIEYDTSTMITSAFILVVILGTITIVLSGYTEIMELKNCKSLGFDYNKNINNLEYGYTMCCNEKYIKHIRNDTCEIIEIKR